MSSHWSIFLNTINPMTTNWDTLSIQHRSFGCTGLNRKLEAAGHIFRWQQEGGGVSGHPITGKFEGQWNQWTFSLYICESGFLFHCFLFFSSLFSFFKNHYMVNLLCFIQCCLHSFTSVSSKILKGKLLPSAFITSTFASLRSFAPTRIVRAKD